MFWLDVILGSIAIIYGVAALTDWRGFAGWLSRTSLFPWGHNVTYQRFWGGIPPAVAGVIVVVVTVLHGP